MCAEIDKRENNYAKIFALFLNAVLIVDFFRMLVNSLIIVNLVQYGIYIGCAIYTYWQIIFRYRLKIDKSFFVLICIVALIAMVSYTVCSEILQAYSYYIPFVLARGIPALFFTIYINKQKLILTFEYLKKFRLLWLLYAIVGMVWITYQINSQYSMTYGYNLLIPACIAFFCFIRYLKVRWLFYEIVFFMCMLLRGSRASVLCLMVFMALAYLMIQKEDKKGEKLTRLILVLLIGIIFLIRFNDIISLLSNTFPSSRTLALLASDIDYDSGRADIQSLFWEKIKLHPFKFNGIFADRIYFSNWERVAYDMTNYPHNFIVELFFQFGIPLGIIFFTLIVLGIVQSILCSNKIKNAELLCFVLVMLVAGFIKLFFSASYLVSVEFYLLIGICICICRKNAFY